MTWEDIQDPSPDFVERVLAIVRSIPTGMVMSYGDIARTVGGTEAALRGKVFRSLKLLRDALEKRGVTHAM